MPLHDQLARLDRHVQLTAVSLRYWAVEIFFLAKTWLSASPRKIDPYAYGSTRGLRHIFLPPIRHSVALFKHNYPAVAIEARFVDKFWTVWAVVILGDSDDYDADDSEWTVCVENMAASMNAVGRATRQNSWVSEIPPSTSSPFPSPYTFLPIPIPLPFHPVGCIVAGADWWSGVRCCSCCCAVRRGVLLGCLVVTCTAVISHRVLAVLWVMTM